MLDDYRSTHRVVDEARIQETETERLIRLKELEIVEKEIALEEKMIATTRRNRTIAFGIALSFVIIGVIVLIFAPSTAFGPCSIMGGVWIAIFTFVSIETQKSKIEDYNKARHGMIKLTEESTKVKNKNVRSVESTYRMLGFQNIALLNLKDLRAGILIKPGAVDSLTIDGKIPKIGKWYNPNSTIVITYHGVYNK